MRILFTTFPAKGHFHPIAPLALAAKAAGHEVRVATGEDLVPWVRKCGLDANPIGLSQPAAIAQAGIHGADAGRDLFTDVWVPPALADLRRLITSFPPDLLVHEEEEYAGLLLATLLGIPCVTHSWHSPVRPAAGRANALELLEPLWRAETDAPPRGTGDIYLDACPAPLQTEQIRDLPNVVNVRPVLFDGPPSTPPIWLSRLDRPAAYVTMGTVPLFSRPDLLRKLVGAVAPLFDSVVATSGPNPTESLSRLPGNVHVHQYLPQSLVLPHVDVVVSQAGAGGTLGAIYYGLPHLALPQGGESQVSMAERIHDLGAGIRLVEGDQTPGRIREAARSLLRDASYRERVAHLRAEIERHLTPLEVVRLLEQIRASRSTPSHSRKKGSPDGDGAKRVPS